MYIVLSTHIIFVLTDISVDVSPLLLLHNKTLTFASVPPIHIDICGISFVSIAPLRGLSKLERHAIIAISPNGTM